MPRSVRTSFAPCEMLNRMPSCSSSRPSMRRRSARLSMVSRRCTRRFSSSRVSRSTRRSASGAASIACRSQLQAPGGHSVRTGTGKDIAEEGDGDMPADIVPAF